jgi:hypothetical protein
MQIFAQLAFRVAPVSHAPHSSAPPAARRPLERTERMLRRQCTVQFAGGRGVEGVQPD